MTMLSVHDLRAGYGKIEVLRDVSIAVEQGQIVTLIGANGAGKTTLLKTISGLIRPIAGKIEFEGQHIARMAPHKITARGISHVPEGRAIQYGIGVGREGFTWSGTDKITKKAKWPEWRPPQEMIEREQERGNYIPAHMVGGPENPLGARALYIGETMYRIHGTNQPWSIGLAVSSGCIRLLNEEVIDLYNRVEVGAEVVVEN